MDQLPLTPYVISDIQRQLLDQNFTYHAPQGDQPQRYNEIRLAGKLLAERLYQLCPPSRELSLAMTNLEQALMWANAAIARHESQ